MAEEIRVRHEIDLGQLERFEKALKSATGDSKGMTSELKKQATAQSKKNKLEKEEVGIVQNLLSKQKALRAEQKVTQDPKRLKQINKELYRVSTNLKKAKNTTATWAKALGSFGFKFNALANAANRLASSITRGLNVALRDAVKTVTEFESAMAGVKAISGATAKEFQKLRSDAIRLGGATIYTARQVAALQMNYAKLGFSTQEILNATSATLSLAAATDEDLAASALVAGSTLRAFNLDAKETSRVVDVMAKSFTSSALNLEHWRESMKFSAAIAQSLGLDIETLAAAMAKLADTGIKGSIAGTSMKNIMLRMGDESSALSQKIGFAVTNSDEFIEALKALNTETFDLTEALSLTDRRAAPALLKLVQMADSVEDLANVLDRSFGEAAKMARIRMDTLKGSLTILKSAWEGFAISLESGSGILTHQLRSLVDWGTKAVTTMKLLAGGVDEFIAAAGSTKAQELYDRLVIGLEGTTAEERLPTFQRTLLQFSGMATKAEGDIRKAQHDMIEAVGPNKLKAITTLIENGGVKLAFETFPFAMKKIAKSMKDMTDAEVSLSTINQLMTKVEGQMTDSEKEAASNAAEAEEFAISLLKKRLKSELSIHELAIREKFALQKNEAESTIKDAELLKDTLLRIEDEKGNELMLAKIDFYKKMRPLVEMYEQKEIDAQIDYMNTMIGLTNNAGSNKPLKGKGISLAPRIDTTKLADISPSLAKSSYIGAILQPDAKNLENYFKAASKATNFVVDQLDLINDAEIRLNNERISRYDQHISELQRALDEEYALRREGKANRVNLLEAEVKEEQKKREEAYKKQEQLEKKKRALEAAAQLGNLLTSATNIWKLTTATTGPLAPPIAIAAIATMIGAWVAQIASIGGSMPKFAEGGWIDGESHSRGGVILNAEGGEFIVRKGVAQQNADVLEAMNNGDMWDKPTFKNLIKIDNKESENLLKELITITKEKPSDFGEYIEYRRGNTIYRIKK